jgi:hypothetical protein
LGVSLVGQAKEKYNFSAQPSKLNKKKNKIAKQLFREVTNFEIFKETEA